MKLPKSFVFIIIFLAVLLITAILIVVARRGSCPTPNFFCYGSDVCIPKVSHCDGNHDCPDGSDENPLDCNQLDGVGLILDVMKIKCNEGNKRTTHAPKLNFKEKNLSCNVDSISKNCTCDFDDASDDITVCCQDTFWETVPWKEFNNTPMRLNFYNFSTSKNFKWNEDEFHLTSLKRIVINNHTTVPWKIFNPNKKLGKIYIEYSEIATIESNAFCGIEELHWLIIRYNPRLERIEPGAFCDLDCLVILDLQSNKLQFENYTFDGFQYLLKMDLRDNRIEKIDQLLFSKLTFLEQLDLANNKIKYIHKDAFISNLELIQLDLSNNNLQKIDPKVLSGKEELKELLLSYNSIQELSNAFMSSIGNVSTLNLEGLDLIKIDLDTFSSMRNLRSISFKNYSYCFYVPKVRLCFPNAPDTISSRLNLLESKVLRYFVWFLGIGILTGNGLVIFMRLYFKKKNKSSMNLGSKALDILVNNLAVSDLLMSIYVYTIAFKDLLTRDTLRNNGYYWLRSWLCQGIGIVYVVSHETSLLFLTLISLERYFVVGGRIDRNSPKIGKKLAMVVSGIIWMTTIILALSPKILLSNSYRFYGSNYLCIPHFLDEPKGLGYEYSALIYIGINSICVLFITMSYTRLFLAVRKTRKKTPDQNIKLSLALRFTILASAEIICSSPMIVGKIMALVGYDIKNYTAFIICLLPFNSAVNPLLYTLTTGEVATTLRGWIIKLSSCVLKNVRISKRASLIWERLRSRPSLDNKEDETGVTDDPQNLTPNNMSHSDSGKSEEFIYIMNNLSTYRSVTKVIKRN